MVEEPLLAAIGALGLLGDEESAEADLALLLRETGNKPNQREILLRALRCCAKLNVAEPFLKIEAEARAYGDGIKKRMESNARCEADQIRLSAKGELRLEWESIDRQRKDLERSQADCKRRLEEMVGPHAPAIALLQIILKQYPLPHGERLPPTAFLSACALVASLMGTNPVDLALNMSGGNFEFSKRNG
jgi:hypothetical protein